MTLGPPVVLEISEKGRGFFLMMSLVSYYSCSLCFLAGLYYSNHLLCHFSTWVYAVNLDGYQLVFKVLANGFIISFLHGSLCLLFLNSSRQMLPFLFKYLKEKKNTLKGLIHLSMMWLKRFQSGFFVLGWNFITSSPFDYKSWLRFTFFKWEKWIDKSFLKNVLSILMIGVWKW